MIRKKPFIIGIAGGSGSGKTTLLRALLNHFDPSAICLVSQDNYYLPRHEQVQDQNGITNFDLPTSIDRDHFVKDMRRLIEGNPIEKSEYNFNNPDWKPKSILVQPAPVIIMEGLFVFHFSEIRQLLQYKVFIEAHLETRLERRIRRDAEERGYAEEDVRYQWDNHVRPAEIQYMEPYRPGCDLIIDNTHSFDTGLAALTEIIESALEQG
ncbi:MAG: uridine kinase [Flavobacteriales bacterium]